MRLARETVAAAAALAAAVAFPALPAAAQTEADCKNAVWQAEQDMSTTRFADSDERGGHIETLLAQAGEAGLQGDYKKCLELVRDAEGAAGETDLLRKKP